MQKGTFVALLALPFVPEPAWNAWNSVELDAFSIVLWFGRNYRSHTFFPVLPLARLPSGYRSF